MRGGESRLPEIDEVIAPAEGVATTGLVQVVGTGGIATEPSHIGSLVLTNDAMWIGSIAVIAASSSPWWTGRVVEQSVLGEVPESPAQATGGTVFAPFGVIRGGSATGVADIAPKGVRRRAPRQLSLDYGLNVTPAFGAEVASPVLERMFRAAWGEVGDAWAAWLMPDPPEVLAAAQPVTDDAEWDDSEDRPQWLSMSGLSYRGGGMMSRRTRRYGGD